MSGFPGDGFTVMLLSGILSRPPSILSSLPPDVDVPLPLFDELAPVVWGGLALGFALLAAGSPLTEPRPLGFPCATAEERLPRIRIMTIADSLMVFPL
jgi:hypothetical protein